MDDERPRVLLLSDDDAVTGTLRRLARIGEQLAGEADVVLATLSAAEPAGPVPASMPLQRIASAAAMNMAEDDWARQYLRPRLDRLIRAAEPELLVVDGAFPAAVLAALSSAHDLPRLEVVSAFDRAERGAAAGAGAGRDAELIVEVGEVLETAAPAQGAAAERVMVPPVLDASVRDQAARGDASGAGETGEERPTAVLDLAGLSPDTAAAAEDLALEWFAAHRPEWTVTLLDSPVARRPTAGVEKRHGGPVPELVRRSILALAVPGVRAVHTWAPAGTPTLWLTERPGAEEPIRGAASRPRISLRPEQMQAARRRAQRAVQNAPGTTAELDGPHDVDRLRAQLTVALESLLESLVDGEVDMGVDGDVGADGAAEAAAAALELVRRPRVESGPACG